mgnify:CR=1 FL=1
MVYIVQIKRELHIMRFLKILTLVVSAACMARRYHKCLENRKKEGENREKATNRKIT